MAESPEEYLLGCDGLVGKDSSIKMNWLHVNRGAVWAFALAATLLVTAYWCAPPGGAFVARPPRNLQRTVERSPESWVKVETTPGQVLTSTEAVPSAGPTALSTASAPVSGTEVTSPGQAAQGSPVEDAGAPGSTARSGGAPWGFVITVLALLLALGAGYLFYQRKASPR